MEAWESTTKLLIVRKTELLILHQIINYQPHRSLLPGGRPCPVTDTFFLQLFFILKLFIYFRNNRCCEFWSCPQGREAQLSAWAVQFSEKSAASPLWVMKLRDRGVFQLEWNIFSKIKTNFSEKNITKWVKNIDNTFQNVKPINTSNWKYEKSCRASKESVAQWRLSLFKNED